ncbi:MAG: hypothetical protein M1298_05880 [Chloroflexi bacterium]|nr:hypothetical protein [Chloroflexota bacterium]
MFILVIVLIVPVSSSSVAAAPVAERLSLRVRMGFSGYYRPDSWTPLTVTVGNDGPSFHGTVTLTEPTIPAPLAGVQISLPSQSTKTVTFLAPTPPNSVTTWQAAVMEGEHVVRRAIVHTVPVKRTDYLIGVLSPDSFQPPLGRELSHHAIKVAQLSVATLPASTAALANLDAIVFDDINSNELTPGQIRALSGWIAGGGQLIIGGGAGAIGSLANLRSPFHIGATSLETVDVAAALEPWLTSQHPSNTPVRDVIAITRLPPDGIVRLRSHATPLVSDIPWGKGWITLLGPAAHQPLLRTGQATPFWDRLLTEGHPWLPPVIGEPAARPPSHQRLPSPNTVLPPARLFFLLMVVYTIVIGPAGWFALRRAGRQAWLWLTIPAMSVGATAALGISFSALRGDPLIASELTVAPMTMPANQAPVLSTGVIAFFSPQRSRYDVLLPDVEGALPLRSAQSDRAPPLAVATDQGERIDNIAGNQWTLRAFQIIGHVHAEKVPQIAPHLALHDGYIVGTIENTGKVALQPLLLGFDGTLTPIAGLLPGERIAIHLPTAGTPQHGSSPLVIPSSSSKLTRERKQENDVLQFLSDSLGRNGEWWQGFRLYAFARNGPFTITIDGHVVRAHGLSLYTMPLSVALQPGQSFPFGLVSAKVLENGDFSGALPGEPLLLAPTAVVQVRLPPSWVKERFSILQIDTELSLRPSPPSPAANLQVALYNWRTGAWDLQPQWRSGVNTLAGPAPYVDPRGYLELRFVGSNGQVQLDTVGLAGTVAR